MADRKLNDSEQEIKELIEAFYPIINVVSSEENRVIDFLGDLCGQTNSFLIIWSNTKGFLEYGVEDEETYYTYMKDLRGMTGNINRALETLEKIPANNKDEKVIFLMLDLHPYFDDSKVIRNLRDIAADFKTNFKTLVMLTPVMNLPVELEKDVAVVDYELPNRDEIKKIIVSSFMGTLRNSMESEDASKNIKKIDRIYLDKIIQSCIGLTSSEIENAIAKAIISSESIYDIDPQVIFNEKRQVVQKSGILDFIPLNEKLGDVGGLNELKSWIRKRSQLFNKKAEKFGIVSPKGMLMVGIQGCGKSLVAKSIASELNVPLLKLDIGSLMQSALGSSEENVRKAIKLSETIGNCVLWMDEIEKGFSGVHSSGKSDAGTLSRVFATFLTWMQEKTKPVFVVATSNDIEALPPEFLRKGRFDEIFFVDLPNVEERTSIFNIHLKKVNRDPKKFDMDSLVKYSEGFSGAEIESSIQSALTDAFTSNRELETKDIINSLKETYPLSQMMPEKIKTLRNWASNRARRATSESNDINIEDEEDVLIEKPKVKKQDVIQSKVKTLREKMPLSKPDVSNEEKDTVDGAINNLIVPDMEVPGISDLRADKDFTVEEVERIKRRMVR